MAVVRGGSPAPPTPMCPDMATLENKLGNGGGEEEESLSDGDQAAEQLDTVSTDFGTKMSLDLDLELKNLLGRVGGAAREPVRRPSKYLLLPISRSSIPVFTHQPIIYTGFYPAADHLLLYLL